MKFKLFFISSLILCMGLTGCARNNANNNVNNDNVAYRNQNGMSPTRVDYTRPGTRGVDPTNVGRTDVRNNNVNNINGRTNTNNLDGTTIPNNIDGRTNVNNFDGRTNPNNVDGNTNNVNNNNNRTTNDNGAKSRMTVANQAAKKIADLPEVDNANVIVTNNNAYVAVKLPSRQKFTNDIQKKISNQVKTVDRNINNVYVSANPDFYRYMQAYTNDIRNGRPGTGLFNEFSRMIQRVFPNAK